MTVIKIYAPTETSWEKDKDDFYDQLNAVMNAAPSYDLKVVMGDFNARIGSNKCGYEDFYFIVVTAKSVAEPAA